MVTRRVLIVEDNPGTQLVLRRMLQRVDETVQVACVSSAEDAYRAVNDAHVDGRPFDLVVADLNLPGSSGLVLKDVSQKLHPTLNFLFVSGVSYAEWFRRISTLKEWPPFLQKPISEEKLRR